jgi:hypothetical protein
MGEGIGIILLIAGYVLVMRYLLPKMGFDT